MNVCTYLNFIYWKLYPYATFKVREGSGANDGIAFRFEYCYKFVLTEFHVPLQMYINPLRIVLLYGRVCPRLRSVGQFAGLMLLLNNWNL